MINSSFPRHKFRKSGNTLGTNTDVTLKERHFTLSSKKNLTYFEFNNRKKL